MQMTPLDIKGKSFGKGVFGYNNDEVNQFLDNVSQEFEALYTENYELREKTKRLEVEITHFRQLENTLQQTLILAQQTADELKNTARREAELIIKEAENDRAHKIAETQITIEGINDEIRRLAGRRDLLRTQLRSFLTSHLDLEKLQEQDDYLGSSNYPEPSVDNETEI